MRRHVCAALLLLACWGGGCTREVQRGLTQPAADEVIVALSSAGVPADIEPEETQGQGPQTFGVVVPSSATARAMAVLAADGLPRTPPKGYGDVYGEGSLVPTSTEERARYAEALSGEIESTLLRLDGVIDARVHLVIPDPEALEVATLGVTPPRATASVLLKLASGGSPARSTDVARLVAGAVAGLDASDVAVVETVASAPRADTEPVIRVGPFWVAPASRRPLIVTLVILVLLATVLPIGALVALARRARA